MKKKTTPGPLTQKAARLHKASRPHRPCPQCGQVKRSVQEQFPHKPGGLKRRRANRAETAESAAQVESSAPSPEAAPAPTPIDAVTVIKGVVERIPEALKEVLGAEALPAAALNAAVRKAVLDEFRTRAQFAGRLAEIDALLWSEDGQRGNTVTTAMEAHLRELRLLRVTEPEHGDRFVVTEGEGERFEVLRPGYVDELTGKVILSGQLRRVAGPEDATAEELA